MRPESHLMHYQESRHEFGVSEISTTKKCFLKLSNMLYYYNIVFFRDRWMRKIPCCSWFILIFLVVTINSLLSKDHKSAYVDIQEQIATMIHSLDSNCKYTDSNKKEFCGFQMSNVNLCNIKVSDECERIQIHSVQVKLFPRFSKCVHSFPYWSCPRPRGLPSC